ncbi:MAG TPA: ABC transporter substrate-binding protein, partial [Dongiaceae bacterium]
MFIFLSAGCPADLAAQSETTPVNIPIAYLTQHTKTLPPLSLADQPTENNGLWGARLGIEDNNTTGKFTGQNFVLSEAVVAEDGDIAATFRDLYGKGNRFFVIDLPEKQLLTVADLPEAKDALLFNIHAKDDSLRNDQCRANVLHTIPDYAMLADGLAQYLIWKRWASWLLVTGTGEDDKHFADALRHAAEKFSATIVEERVFDAETGSRRTDTGHAQIQKQMPVFTQDAEDYD